MDCAAFESIHHPYQTAKCSHHISWFLGSRRKGVCSQDSWRHTETIIEDERYNLAMAAQNTESSAEDGRLRHSVQS